MIYRKKKAYILAIHGCPVWAAIGLGNGTDMYIEDYFPDHHGDGGTAVNLLESAPTFNEVVDVTGGFGRLSDASFSIVDTRDNVFAKFFAASKTHNLFSNLIADFKYTDSLINVHSTASFQAGDVLYLPRETIQIGSINTINEMSVSRSLYSCFTEGRWPSYNAVHQALQKGADIVKGGHWAHTGRWVCVYEAETNGAGTFSEPKRIYAGIITEATFDGKKVTVSTKSITSMLSDPILRETVFRMDSGFPSPVTDFRLRLTANNYTGICKLDTDWTGVSYLNINDIVEQDLNFRELNQYTFGLKYTVSPGMIDVQPRGATPTFNNCPSAKMTHPAFTKLYDITDNMTDTATGKTTSGGSSMPAYDAVLLPGFRFKFDSTGVVPSNNDQFFLFENGNEDSIICKCNYVSADDCWEVEPSIIYGWYTDKGDYIEYYENGYEARWLLLKRSICTIKPVLLPNTGGTIDLIKSIYQIMASTGESFNPNEDGSYSWWQSYGIPYYLLDYTSFANIMYLIRPVIFDRKSMVEIFESSLKIAGWRIVWSFESGKLVAKQNTIPYPDLATIEYTHANVTTEKPNTAIGYQAPLSSVSVEWKRVKYEGGSVVGGKYSFSMSDSISQYNAGVELNLSDDLAMMEFPDFSTVAYNNILWLSTAVPSSIVKVDVPVGDVGDVVRLSNYYIADAEGYGVSRRAGMQTEISVGMQPTVRILFSGNTITNRYCLLAPAAVVDQTIGDRGYDSKRIMLESGPHEDGRNWCQYVKDLTTLTELDLEFKTKNDTMTVRNCEIDTANNRIVMPDSFTGWPDPFATYDSSTEIWVTLANYWLY